MPGIRTNILQMSRKQPFRQNVPLQSRPPSTKPRVYEVRKEESTNKSSTEEKELFIGELMTTAGNVSKSTTEV